MTATITLAQLRAFVAVTDCGGFTAAAAKLGVAQSTLSEAVGALGANLGVVLLTRHTDGIALTAAGRAILVEAAFVVSSVERINAHAAEARGVEPGSLRIATVRSAARRLLPRALAAFRVAHPQVTVSLLEGSDKEVEELVRSGAAELGLAAFQGDGLASELIAEDGFVLVARPGHRLLGRGPVSPAALNGEPFVMSSDGCEPLIQELFATSNSAPKIIIRIGDIATLLGTVREGLGVTIIPELALPGDNLLDLRMAPMDTPQRRQLLAVEMQDRPRNRAVGAFLPMLKAQASLLLGRPRSVAA